MLEKREAYKYKALKQDGECIEGIVYSFSQQEAFAKILNQGYTPEIIEKTDLADKRAYERKSISAEVRYGLFGKRAKLKQTQNETVVPVFKENFYGITQNISAGGLLFSTPQQLNIGTVINVILELPDEDEKIQTQCRVIRGYEIEQDIKYEIAVCFIDLSAQAKEILNSKIRKISRHFDRREYERFTEQIKLYFDLVVPIKLKEKLLVDEKDDRFMGQTIDISAGGMLFAGPADLKKDQIIEVEIKFEAENKTIATLAKVVRVIQIKSNENKTFQAAVIFLNIVNSDKNWLSRYVSDYNA